jgi:LacI family transcriptional regulator
VNRKRLQGSLAAAPTVRTVAALAGVSIASASRVLNGLGGSPETARRVREAAAQVGYVPNAIARSLQAQRTGLLALAVDDIGNPVYVQMMRAVEEEAAAAGYRLIVHATGGGGADELELLRGLARRYVDGLILSPIRIGEGHLAAIANTAVPVVVIGQLPDGVPVDNVRTDSRTGVALAVRHLVTQGRRRIGFLNGPLDTVPGAARQAGYQVALAQVGLPMDESLIEIGAFKYAEGRAAAERLLARAGAGTGGLDAIVCANDLIAVGALHALLASGRRVPEEIALVGMDDTELAQMSFPQLSSVSLGSAERGGLAARLLLDRLARPDLPARRELVPPKLIVRASSTSQKSTIEKSTVA